MNNTELTLWLEEWSGGHTTHMKRQIGVLSRIQASLASLSILLLPILLQLPDEYKNQLTKAIADMGREFEEFGEATQDVSMDTIAMLKLSRERSGSPPFHRKSRAPPSPSFGR